MSVLTTTLWGIPTIASFALLILLIRSQDRFAAVAKSGWTRILTGAVFFFIFCLTLFLLHLPVIEMLLGNWSDWIAMAAFFLFAIGIFLVIPAAIGWLSDIARLKSETDKRISSVSLTEDLLELAEQPSALTELLTAGTRSMIQHSECAAGMVWLLARDNLTLILAGGHGFDKATMKAAESVVTTGQELFDRALKGHQAITAGDLSTRTRFLQTFPGMDAFRSVAVVPLSGGSSTIGMVLLASREEYHFAPILLRSLAGAGRVLGSAVAGQRLQRDLTKLERETEEKKIALKQWESTLGGGVPATIHTSLHGLLDALDAKAAFLVPSGARFIPYATDPAVVGLPLDGVWSEAIAQAEQNGRALWVNPGRNGSDPRNGLGRWIAVPSPAGLLFFVPNEEKPSYTGEDLARIARLGEIAMLLAPAPETHPVEELLAMAGRMAEQPGSAQVFAEVTSELAEGAEAVLVWKKHEGRLRIAATQGCSMDPLAELNLPVGQGTIGKAALAVQPLSVESAAELGRSWAEYTEVERDAFCEAFGGLERPLAEYLAPVPHADMVLQLVRFTRGGWSDETANVVDALVHLFRPKAETTATDAAPVTIDWGEHANDLNNLLTGIIGQAELLSRRLEEAGVPKEEREVLDRIIAAAQSGGDIVANAAVHSPSDHTGGLDNLAAEFLSGRHITDNLYLLPENRAVQITTSFEPTPQPNSDRQKMQGVLWSALTAVARDQNALGVSTSSDERFLYLAVGNQEGKEPLKGPYGDYFRAPDLTWKHVLPMTDLDFLRSEGAQIAADDEKNPRRLVVRFPYGSAASAGKSPHPGLRVLAIDDQEIIRDLLLNMFMGMGHRITVCKSGEEGLEELNDQTFDLVLTDLGMPGMSGWEVAQAVKQKYPDTPVVLITGWGFNFAEEQVKKAGVDYVLTKPFRLEHLTEIVEAAVRRAPQVH